MPEGKDVTQGLTGQGDVAIIGMACMFPRAPDLDTYWHNIVSKVDAITDPPPEAWDSDVYYDPDSTESNRVYCKRGGFLGPLAYFDPLEHGIPPVAVGGEPDQWLALKVAREALADAGYPDGPENGHQTAVILGKGTYVNHGNLSMVQNYLVVDQTMRILKTLHPEYTDADFEAIRQELRQSLPPVNPETVPGLIPNIIAGRIANRLDLMGPSYTVDAACASSLIAVDIAMRELAAGRCDMALVGGTQVSTPVPIFGVFCQLNALSRKQQIRPFDKDADGTILGEGIGIVILKRREDAERHGDRIYALIKGTGISSDGRGLSVVAPRVEGEELALRRAFGMANLSPRTVGLIEAHGTGTPVGDVAEIEALTRVFATREKDELPWCGLGTVKSMIGHAMPAAGIAGLIKAALSLYHRVLPPTINFDQPNPELELEKTPFYINTETRPWIHGSRDAPRRAGVNAFGFGGINAHVVLEEQPDQRETTARSHYLHWDSEVFILQASSRATLIQQAQQLEQYLSASPEVCLKDLAYTLNAKLGESPYRLALVASSLADLQQKLARALQRLSDASCQQIKDRGGIYFFEQPVGRAGKLAFLFPGEGAQYPNMLADLCLRFPEVRTCFDQLDRIFTSHPRKYLPSDYIFPRPAFSEEESAALEGRLWQMDGAIEGVLTANHALFTLLTHLGLRPDAILGHSTGEYSAMRASGILDLNDESAFSQFALDLNRMYEQEVAQDTIPRATLIAVGTNRAEASAIADQVGGDIHVAMDNCPHQTVIVGDRGAAADALKHIQRLGLFYQVLPFDRAYHTPLFEPYLHGLRQFFARFPMSLPTVQIWSCTTSLPYPADVAEIRKLAVEHWMRPVEFGKTIDAMYADGARIFVEVGPRSNLTSFVDDILRGKPYLAVPANVERRSGITQLNHLVGILAAQGIQMELDYLYRGRAPQQLSLDAPSDAGAAQKKTSTPMKLATGWPPMNVSKEFAQRLRSQADGQTAPADTSDSGPGAAVPSTSLPATPPDTTGLAPEHVAQTPDASGTHATSAADVKRREPVDAMPTPQALTGFTSQPMLAYLETMEQFLDAQQEVMEAFLRAAQGALPADADVALQMDSATYPRVEEQPDQPSATQPVPIPAPQAEPAKEDYAPSVESAVVDLSAQAIKDDLLALVSERTGYPVDMLGLDMDMEGDLGIDSIKRVEVLGAFRARHGLAELQGDLMESISKLKTLQQVVDFLEEACNETKSPTPVEETHAKDEPAAQAEEYAKAQDAAEQFPLIEVKSLLPGEELAAVTQLRWDEDLFLHDHTLGRQISVTDPTLRALPVMPLTLSMEILAEAGALLMPDKLLVSMRDIRAHRWIALEEEAVSLEILAGRKPGRNNEVDVKIQGHKEGGSGEAPPRSPLVEGTLVFADAYPPSPSVGEFSLREERASKWASWTPERLYQEVMFHGPCWQGVASVDRWGEDGSVATLRVLPSGGFFRSTPSPRFVTDTVVLDAAGQIVGFWAMEHLKSGFLVFPFHVEELHIYGPNLPVNSEVRCQARINLVGTNQVSSDIDMVGPDGRLWMRLVGWKDRRFDLPDNFYQSLLSPLQNVTGSPWELPISSFPTAASFQCFRIEGAFESDRAFWIRVWAHLVLSANERKTFGNLRGPETRQIQWLMGRITAKDAIRAFMRQMHNVELCPADVEIVDNEHGQPIPQGAWTRTIEAVPSLSLAHTDGIAVAVAGAAADGLEIGMDIERIRARPEGFGEIAFLPEERALLHSLEESNRDEWVTRFWCAKEAVAKSLGRGLVEGPQSVAVQGADWETGVVRATVGGKLAAQFPELAKSTLVVYTGEEDGYAVAVTFCEKEQAA